MFETKYKVRARFPSDLVNKLEELETIHLEKNEKGEISASWLLRPWEVREFLDNLYAAGVRDVILEESAIQIYALIEEGLHAQCLSDLRESGAIKVAVQNDVFSTSKVLSFVVRCKDAERVHAMVIKHEMTNVMGIECFLVLDNGPEEN